MIASVAQWIRASDYGSEGREFKSSQTRDNKQSGTVGGLKTPFLFYNMFIERNSTTLCLRLK